MPRKLNTMKSLILLTSGLAALLSACAKPPATTKDTSRESRATQVNQFDQAPLNALLSGVIDKGEMVGVSALVFDEGKIVYQGAFGDADRERGRPMTTDTVVRIYSMTKTVTSAIILDLIEDGDLAFDDLVTDFIPELGQMQVMSADADGNPVFTPQIAPITIKDLLLHRSGLGYGIFGPSNPVEALYDKANLFDPTEKTADKMIKLSKLPLVAQPGTGWYYSLSTDVLGHVVELVTDQRLGEVMQERIFTPCGMDETGFFVKPALAERFASTYLLQEDGSFVVADDAQASAFLTDNAYQSGGGGLVSTLGDYAIFAQLLLDGGTCADHRVLETDTVDAMLSNQMDPDDLYLFPWLGGDTNNGFGYGGSVVIADSPEQIAYNGQSVGHFGWNGAARTTYWIDRPNNAFAIMFLQYFGGEDPQLHRDFRKLVREQTKN